MGVNLTARFARSSDRWRSTVDVPMRPRIIVLRELLLLSRMTQNAWPDPTAAQSTLRDLLFPDHAVAAYPIDRAVNKPQNHGPELIQPL